MTGTQGGNYPRTYSPKADLAAIGAVPGRTYTLSCAGASGDCYVAVQFYKQDGGSWTVVCTGNPVKFDVPAGSVSAVFFPSGGPLREPPQELDAMIYPMLCEGAPAGYVPYELGGGQVLDNIWLDSGELGEPDGLSVTRLDDGGYRIVGDPETPWSAIMTAAKPIGAVGIAEGDAVCLSLFGIEPDNRSGIGAYVSFDDEAGRVLAADYGTGTALVVPAGAHRMRCGISTSDAPNLKHVDAVAYPMLARGYSAAPHYVPYAAGNAPKNPL